ncbi:MAG: hypothetical protein K6E92_00690 [Lachnospiraceae bacterium]|nr:hypothetical protein [Lachnospiraceae bacterium]
MKNGFANNCILCLFFVLIFLFPVMRGVRSVADSPLDAELEGFTDEAEPPVFTGESWWNGTFQNDFTSDFDGTLPLRGCLTRTYGSFRYGLFRVGNVEISETGDVFGSDYLNAAACVGEYDFSDPGKQQMLQETTAHLESINRKLQAVGKKLLVYTASGKATLYPGTMPRDYAALKTPEAVSGMALFRSLMEETDVPCLFCDDLIPKLDYPAFYPTGTHWSRTYEQICSRAILQKICELTGTEGRIFELRAAQESDVPYWRDTDIYDLLNKWGYPDLTYYEYLTQVPEREGYDALDILLQGDSFAWGLMHDVAENLPEDRIAFISRCDSLRDDYGKDTLLKNDWARLDLQYCLDLNDVVVMEVLEPEILHPTYGFAAYLDAYLDTYVPQPKSTYYAESFDGALMSRPDLTCAKGFYKKELGYSWIQPRAGIRIREGEIPEKGMEITYLVPGEIFFLYPEDTVQIYVNGRKVADRTYRGEQYETLILTPEEAGDPVCGGYSVEFYCSEEFSPCEVGEGEDDRQLALRLEYVGGPR